MLSCCAVSVPHILRGKKGLSIDNNCVHAILKDNDTVTKNSNNRDRKLSWVRFEREYLLLTAHIDLYQNDRGEYRITVEDDVSRIVLEMIETEILSIHQECRGTRRGASGVRVIFECPEPGGDY